MTEKRVPEELFDRQGELAQEPLDAADSEQAEQQLAEAVAEEVPVTINPHLPRVTDVLRDAGLIDTTWYTKEGTGRGAAVHLACQYYDEGDLDFDSLDPELEGYVSAYAAWRQESGLSGSEWIECPMTDPRGLYRGTSDRIFTARPRSLWDIKTGAFQAWIALQTAAYVNMLPDPYSYSRFSVHLSPDGAYSVREFPKADYAQDLAVFLSALNIVNYKRRRSNGC